MNQCKNILQTHILNVFFCRGFYRFTSWHCITFWCLLIWTSSECYSCLADFMTCKCGILLEASYTFYFCSEMETIVPELFEVCYISQLKPVLSAYRSVVPSDEFYHGLGPRTLPIKQPAWNPSALAGSLATELPLSCQMTRNSVG